MRLMGFRFSYKSHLPSRVNINHFPRRNNAAGQRKKKRTPYIFTRHIVPSSFTPPPPPPCSIRDTDAFKNVLMSFASTKFPRQLRGVNVISFSFVEEKVRLNSNRAYEFISYS